MAADLPPNHTLYINNLNEKTKLDELKKGLYTLFGQFGPIVDVCAKKTLKKRGQAFVVFQDIAAAATALRAMQGFSFMEKPMKVSFAKAKSDAIAKLDGTYKERASKKRKAEGDDGNTQFGGSAGTGAGAGAAGGPAAKRADARGAAARRTAAAGEEPPNQILFLTSLPADTTADRLTGLFQQFSGFVEVRMIPGRPDIAFVEFESELMSTVAKDALQGFRLSPTDVLHVAFAKK